MGKCSVTEAEATDASGKRRVFRPNVEIVIAALWRTRLQITGLAVFKNLAAGRDISQFAGALARGVQAVEAVGFQVIDDYFDNTHYATSESSNIRSTTHCRS
ncbi:hypothetical protein BI364_10070 [Acidihalobacter yilgarnensis]|uniref:Uncharacterized protein n=1 Tax=Acidihalobacter yilgarnensis TaxID=2819280 RepID=A0A1D8IP95_9GAMM|nr:hypothetical protein BI364_10070 [Acidihalobacter yilgarnensis]